MYPVIRYEDNFIAYRRLLKEGPGIPFLFPHRKEYELRGTIALGEIFIAMAGYTKPNQGIAKLPPIKENKLFTRWGLISVKENFIQYFSCSR